MSTMTMMGKSKHGRSVAVTALVLVAGMLALAAPAALAQQADVASAQPQAPAEAAAPAAAPDAKATHTPAPADTHSTPATNHAADPAADHGAAATHAAAEADHGEAPHGESLWVTLARVANFAILAGVIFWFARKPLATHLATRGAQIRKDLVDAAETRTMATAHLAEIEAKLAALPAELDDLRRRGAEELESERGRIRAVAEIERDRLVEQARREIASQTRNARAQLRAHAATLSVEVAEARLEATLTPAEQSGLVDRFAAQMRNVQ